MITKTRIQTYSVNLKNYQIIEEINSGGFGIVYLVENQKNGKRLAAKVINHVPNSSINKNRYISRELAILTRVHAPTIVNLLGFSLEDFQGNPNITILMDFKENGTLKQLIEKEIRHESPRNYDNTTKQIILCGIAHGMMILHSRPVIHRDLKPENILLDSNFHPFISDFGLAKFYRPEKSRSQSLEGCGTISYMAPEVIDGNHYDCKADVYSFGILMFEVITGQRAFDDLLKKKRYGALLVNVMNGERPTFKTPIKPCLKALIEECWSQDPSNRPSFRVLFHKLSLSLEDDDETIESTYNDLLDKNHETDKEENEFPTYCLDDIDYDRLFDYIEEITREDSSTIENLLQRTIDKQSQLIKEHQKRIDELEARHLAQTDQLTKQNLMQQNQINELTKLYQENREEVEFLKMKLREFDSSLDQEMMLSDVPATPIDRLASGNPLEGLTAEQINYKIRKDKLEYITIPSSVTFIEDKTFSDCNSIKEIRIPSTVTYIGFHAFETLSNLKKIIVDSDNPQFVSIAGVLFTKDTSIIIRYPIKKSKRTYAIPQSVTSIGHFAFSDCVSLSQISIPSSMKSIGAGAFVGCSSLSQITIPASVTSIGNCAFFGCNSLTQITILSPVPSIGSGAFYNCSSLTQIELPLSVTYIGPKAFYNCNSLARITLPPSVTSIGQSAFHNCTNLPLEIRNYLIMRFGNPVIW